METKPNRNNCDQEENNRRLRALGLLEEWIKKEEKRLGNDKSTADAKENSMK